MIEIALRMGSAAAVLCMATACATGPTVDGDRAYDLHADAYQRFLDEDYPGASAAYDLAIQELKPDTPQYFADRWYVQHAWWRSNQATLELFEDRPERAREIFLEVPDILRNGQAGHVAQVEEENEIRAGIGSMLTFAAVVAGAVAGSQGATVEQAEALTSGLVDVTNVITQATDPTLLSDSAPMSVETDYVRMPAFLNMGSLTAIGRLVAPTHTCTGALVHDRIVLTNAHCVTGEDRIRHLDPNDLSFQAWNLRDEQALLEGRPTQSTGIARIVTSPDYKGDGDYVNDWALLVTYESFGFHLGTNGNGLAEEAGTPLVIAGYSADLNNGRFLTMDYGCEILDSEDGLLNYNCATFNGSSGSPILLAQGPDRLKSVVGVHACGRWLNEDFAAAAALSKSATDRSQRHSCGASMRVIFPHFKRLMEELGQGA